MHRHLWIVLALALVSAVAGCSGPNSPSGLPPPPPPPPVGIELAGMVIDTASRPLVGARVEVVAGEGAGLSVMTDSSGNFHLRGPFDATTQVRATANGHVDVTRPFPAFCAPCRPNHWLYFTLESTAPHADLAGNYLMTFVAAGECPGLPNEARERTYTATVTRAPWSTTAGNSQFDLTFSGATVLDHFPHVGGMGIAGDYLLLWLWLADGTGVVEEIATNTYIALEGEAKGSVGLAASEIVLPFNGFIEHCALSAPMPGPS